MRIHSRRIGDGFCMAFCRVVGDRSRNRRGLSPFAAATFAPEYIEFPQTKDNFRLTRQWSFTAPVRGSCPRSRAVLPPRAVVQGDWVLRGTNKDMRAETAWPQVVLTSTKSSSPGSGRVREGHGHAREPPAQPVQAGDAGHLDALTTNLPAHHRLLWALSPRRRPILIYAR